MADVLDQVLEFNSEEERVKMLKNMGAKNCDPPLQHSPFVRNKKTGVVLPWNPLLADQTEILECCDENGNTDPKAWKSKVIHDDFLSAEDAQQLATINLHKMTRARQAAVNELRSIGIREGEGKTVGINENQPSFPDGAMSYSDFVAEETFKIKRARRSKKDLS